MLTLCKNSLCHALRLLRGFVLMTLVALNLLATSISIISTAALRFLIPNKHWRHAYYLRVTNQVPVWWSYINYWLLTGFNKRQWIFSGTSPLNTDQSYLMISNHQSWSDIIILCGFFAGKTPSFKFFMKKELLWSLPLGGLACYCLGFPIMHRHTRAEIRKNPALKGQDIKTTINACELFKKQPTTIVNFVEGTRYTPEKATRQQTPYKHLLKPKVGGVAVVLNALSKELSGILNVTLNYKDARPSLWRVLTGQVSKIHIHYELIPITKALLGDYYGDRQYRAELQQWLNQLWIEKNNRIDSMEAGNDA